ncbi:arylacetamide deacetylase-like [Notamacropus eugenii]|uniref:arylacetamide deacetylase-like n=1 Tax=Notamacropus eugenii TaxID=9315 RepID=UPI003B67BD55
MGPKAVCLIISCTLLAWYMHTTFSANFEQPWKLMLMDSSLKILQHMASLLEKLGLMSFWDFLHILMRWQIVEPISDENVTVTDAIVKDVLVRYYVSKKKSHELKRAIIYFHGGGASFGTIALPHYDVFARLAANTLDAVVVGSDYRKIPKYHHPTQWSDAYDFLKSFLQPETLAKYGVDPTRVCILGDSSGAAVAAAMTQQVMGDPEIPIKPKAQALIYPVLQMLDTDMPSYRENEYGIMLPKSLLIKMMSEYLGIDESLEQAMKSNQHIPAEYSHLLKFVNWSTLLPERFKKGHVYTERIYGSSEIVKKFPGIVDPRANPLLANDSTLSLQPLTYILTCQYDILRDDGLIYVSRLRNNGVQVFHEHIEEGFHGSLMCIHKPFDLDLGWRLVGKIISWINENL